MDDLESFFYVLCHILFTYPTAPNRDRRSHNELQGWAVKDATVCAAFKSSFIVLGPECTFHSTPGTAAERFIEKLCQFFKPTILEVHNAMRERRPIPMTRSSNTASYLDAADENYMAFVTLIDSEIGMGGTTTMEPQIL